MAAEANKTGEVLDVDEQGTLCLASIEDLQTDEPAEHIAPTFENLLQAASDMQQPFNSIRNNCVKHNKIVDIK